jgi:hypothetical protein
MSARSRNLPNLFSLVSHEPTWGSIMARGVLSGEGAQAGLGVLTGFLVVALILFATTVLVGG